ncbi:MAG: thioredoxin family protein [Myxococcales bacterium]|nr:thioredoxin family protein [Myxococcales bacterium]
MTMHIVKDAAELEAARHSNETLAVVGFFGEFSAAAKEARVDFEAFCRDNDDLETYLVDVGEVRGAHKGFGVSSVPTVISLREGSVLRQVVGRQSAAYYARALIPHGYAGPKDAEGKAPRRHSVTVYTTPTCSWCTRLKSYLRQNNVAFREVDVSRDAQAAADLVRRSGQQGVPQTDIDGTMIVGFDQGRIDGLLGLKSAGA